MVTYHFLLPTITTIFNILFFLSPPTAANPPVIDIDGNPLEVGSQYYVLTSGRGAAGRGGLFAVSKPPQLCPRYVAQFSFEIDQGRPINFYPADPSQKQITEGDDINIAFSGPNYCQNLGVWQLTFDEKTMIPYVSTNGVIGNPGPETFSNWFKIEKTIGGSYKIVYCFLRPAPRIMGGKRENCQQLDATQPGPYGVPFLSLVPIDNPLPFFGFVFKKVTTDDAATSTYY
ncbi:Miraculin [Bienertia sinuspersici]